MPLAVVRAVMRDLGNLRELTENVARSLWTISPPQNLMGTLQRSLRTLYRTVEMAEHISGYLNKSFIDGFPLVLNFANSGEREYFNASAARRWRDIRRDNSEQQSRAGSTRGHNNQNNARNNQGRNNRHRGGQNGSNHGQNRGNNRNNKATTPTVVQCYKCGEQGHRSPECPKK